MKNLFLYGLIIILLVLSCDNNEKKIPKHGPYKHQIKTSDSTYITEDYIDGRLVSKHEGKGKYLHGKSEIFYKSGNLHSVTYYENGMLEGLETKYFDNGEKVSVTAHSKNKKHGVSKTWHSNGQQKSEIEYINGTAQPGLKEWEENGNLIKYPTLVLRRIDRMIYENKYILEFSLSDKSKKVKFYQVFNFGRKDEYKIKIDTKNGIGRHEIPISRYEYIMEDLVFRAEKKSNFGNPIVLQEKIRIAIHNN